MKKTKYTALTILLLTAFISAQTPQRFIYLDEAAYTYDYYDYLVNSGKYVPDYVLNQPYVMGPDSVIEKQSKTDTFFGAYWRHFYGENKDLSMHINIDMAGKMDEAIYGRHRIEGAIHYTGTYITLGNRTTVDQEYRYDPNFAGDLSESENWLYGRVNEAYMNLNYKGFNLFLGRMKRNWGDLTEKSLILSSNPYSYDHILFEYTAKHFKLSLLYAPLENRYGLIYYPDSTIAEVKNARRHLVGHRLDIQFSKNLQIAFTEMAVYGGENRPFELAFFNPMNFYYALQRNDRELMSGLWSLDVFYKPFPRLSLYAQFLIDDVIVNNDPGVDDRARFPDRLGLHINFKTADYLLKGLNSSIAYLRIWNRTYQSRFNYENYHYRALGLGYPCASCEEFKIKLAYWNWFPFFIKNETIIGRYGDVELTDLFMLNKEPFPVPPVTDNVITITDIVYFINENYRASVQFFYRKNVNHYSNKFGEKDNFVIKIKFNALFSFGVDVN
ncbi:MAG TPA: hypothetical protein EYP36_07485 [Calditrichaeota bacterium]|nr:hypothetical protein [Calditrichota bacterium]